MAIRAWFYEGLYSSTWDSELDTYVPAPKLAALFAFPDDYHLFILTKYQATQFEEQVAQYPTLKIHYKQDKASVSYRYPTEGPKLLTYILKVVK